jgi:hypothetical protein
MLTYSPLWKVFNQRLVSIFFNLSSLTITLISHLSINHNSPVFSTSIHQFYTCIPFSVFFLPTWVFLQKLTQLQPICQQLKYLLDHHLLLLLLHCLLQGLLLHLLNHPHSTAQPTLSMCIPTAISSTVSLPQCQSAFCAAR